MQGWGWPSRGVPWAIRQGARGRVRRHSGVGDATASQGLGACSRAVLVLAQQAEILQDGWVAHGAMVPLTVLDSQELA